jgi:hypothetical protein
VVGEWTVERLGTVVGLFLDDATWAEFAFFFPPPVTPTMTNSTTTAAPRTNHHRR